MKIYWDIDGVLRDLSGTLPKKVQGQLDYSENVSKESWHNGGKLLKKYLTPRSILKAKSLPYIKAAKYFAFDHPLRILSCQNKKWIEPTVKWLYNHLDFANGIDINFVKANEDKISLIEKEKGFLIDDYPFFKDYSRVIVVDYAYNRKVVGEFARVKSIGQLKRVLISAEKT